MRINLKEAIKKRPFWITLSVITTVLVLSLFKQALNYTSTDQYCMSCHVHPHAENSWMLSTHVSNRSGFKVNCTNCHLPPKEDGIYSYTFAKAKHGAKDVYGYLFKDHDEIDWIVKRQPEVARDFVYMDGCIKCHDNLFPVTLSDKGGESHLRFSADENEEKHCIKCHIGVGHYDPNNAHDHNTDFGAFVAKNEDIYEKATTVKTFENYEERIPGTAISFNMIAIPGGTFKMGSPKSEKYRQTDEGPVREVQLKQFWMGEIEVSWDEFLAYFNATSSQGRKEADTKEVNEEVDGISGATPPWGAPDQGWGKDSRPAITMSHLNATTYCRWLTQVTGKKYRLPTEAEWEYAARGGTDGEFFFGGEASDYTKGGIIKSIFGNDSETMEKYVIFENNSPLKTQEPSVVEANPFGLKNMLGNVAEFCLDWYDPMVYQKYPKGIVNNPRGPRDGQEHVVRGGSYNSSPAQLRVANRAFTRTTDWLVTDPQIPKSIWWYSDSKNVGFRVVCEFDEEILNQ